MASFTVPENGFNVTDYGPGVIPPSLFAAQCDALYIEFLRISPDGRTPEEIAKLKNHAIFKVDFTGEVESFHGARISMNVNFDLSSETSAGGSSHKPGAMLLYPVRYKVASFSSACTVVVPLRQNITLGHLIRAITDNHLQHFYFCTVNDKYYGCRDFVSQAAALLVHYGYIGPEIDTYLPQQLELPSRNIYRLLGLRFPTTGGNPNPCPIDMGWFRYYSRVLLSDMRYN